MNKKKLRLMITSFESKFEIDICQILMNEEIYIKRNVISALRINKSFGKTCQIDHFWMPYTHFRDHKCINHIPEIVLSLYIPFWFIWLLHNTTKIILNVVRKLYSFT